MMGKWDNKSFPHKKQSYIELNCEILTIILPYSLRKEKCEWGKKINQDLLRTYSFLDFSHHIFIECSQGALQIDCYLYTINEDKVAKQIGPRPSNKCQRPNSVKICLNPHLFLSTYYTLWKKWGKTLK